MELNKALAGLEVAMYENDYSSQVVVSKELLPEVLIRVLDNTDYCLVSMDSKDYFGFEADYYNLYFRTSF